MEKYDYSFPEVFVENVESEKYIVEVDENTYIVTSELSRYKYGRLYGHVIYEDILNYIDLVKPVITRSIIIVKKYSGGVMNGILVEKGVSPCLIEVRGYKPVVFLEEGDEVEEGDKIAYVITNKGEVRVIRSPCTGVVVLIINITWERPEKYIVVVVSRDEFRQITIRESP